MSLLKKLLLGRSAVVVWWVVVWLVLLDVGVNLALGSRATSSSTLGRYFEYGRSVEGKLARAVANPKKDGQILGAGWTTPETLQIPPAQPKSGTDLLVAVYGQSFSMHAANAAAASDGRLTVRGVGGPAAPPSHSYHAYKADTPYRKTDVVVFGLLSSSIADMGSMSGLMWHFENPAPFTFPRYRLDGSQLTEELPLIRSEAEFLQAFSQQSDQWQQFKAQLKKSDRGYDAFTFEKTPADSSAIVRLVRRGWVAHNDLYEEGVYDSRKGFNPEAQDIKVLKAMLMDLSRRSKERGERLMVLLLHTRGQSDHLHAVLESTLKESKIDYISTHTLFSANDPTNFLPDSHYVPAANRKLSTALASWIRRGTPQR
ncbi:MAG: hypothetical protein H7Y33_14465 [Cytophagales bacterium]|nr:hypothetical protein [Rhizobacter sp.]